MRRAGVTRLGVAVLLTAVGTMSCGRTPMLYPAPAVPVPSPPPPPLEEVWLEVTGVGRIAGWFQEGSGSGPCPVFLHGNVGNLETLRLSGALASFAEIGLPSLAVDYPGYGRSDGKPSETGLVASAVAAVDWTVRRCRRPIVLVGWSLGAAVALQAAAESRVAGVVAMSPWTSLDEIGREHFPGWMVGLFARERYDSLGAASELDVPALVIHGARDQIIPADHGRRVAEALAGARWVEVAGYGHNDLLAAPIVWEELRGFLAARG